MSVAVPRRTAAKHDGDNVSSIAMHRGHEVETGGAGVTGLYSVDTANHPQEMVVISHRAAVINKLLGGEIFVVAGKPFLDCASEQRLVARRRYLSVVRQSRGVDIGRVAHAKRMRLLRH